MRPHFYARRFEVHLHMSRLLKSANGRNWISTQVKTYTIRGTFQELFRAIPHALRRTKSFLVSNNHAKPCSLSLSLPASQQLDSNFRALRFLSLRIPNFQSKNLKSHVSIQFLGFLNGSHRLSLVEFHGFLHLRWVKSHAASSFHNFLCNYTITLWGCVILYFREAKIIIWIWLIYFFNFVYFLE